MLAIPAAHEPPVFRVVVLVVPVIRADRRESLEHEDVGICPGLSGVFRLVIDRAGLQPSGDRLRHRIYVGQAETGVTTGSPRGSRVPRRRFPPRRCRGPSNRLWVATGPNATCLCRQVLAIRRRVPAMTAASASVIAVGSLVGGTRENGSSVPRGLGTWCLDGGGEAGEDGSPALVVAAAGVAAGQGTVLGQLGFAE